MVNGPVQVCFWVHWWVIQATCVHAGAHFRSQFSIQSFQFALRARGTNGVKPLVHRGVLDHPWLRGGRPPGRGAWDCWEPTEHVGRSCTPQRPKHLNQNCYGRGGSVRGDCFDQKPCDELRHLMGQFTTHRTQHSQQSKSKVAASFRETLSIANRQDEI